MRVLLSKFCEYACKLENGRHNMIGIFDDVRVPSFPVDHPGFFLCVQLEFERTEAGRPMQIETLLMDEDGKQLFKAEMSGTIPQSQGVGAVKMFVQIGVPAMRFERAGDYRLDVLFNGQSVGEERLPVYAVQAPAN
jgi:hypothetical protein